MNDWNEGVDREKMNLAIAQLETQFFEKTERDTSMHRPPVDTLNEGVANYLVHLDPLDDDVAPLSGSIRAWGGGRLWAKKSRGSRPEDVAALTEQALRSLGSVGSSRLVLHSSGLTNLPAIVVAHSAGRDEKVAAWLARGPEELRSRLRLDLAYVLQRLDLLFERPQGDIWMESHNYHLNGRPIDVIINRGTSEVIAAIEAEEQGAL